MLKFKIQVNVKTNKQIIYFYFLGVSHCADVYPSTSSDPPQLSKARETVVSYLKKWLEENGP